MWFLEIGLLLGLFWLAYQGIRVASLLVRSLVTILVGWPRYGRFELVGGIHEPPAGVEGSSLHSLARTRLRRRSRWVCSLQALLGGDFGLAGKYVSGRWRPDLPADAAAPVVNFMAALLDDGAEILGGGSLPGDENVPRVPYLHVRLVDGVSHTVFPELVATLSNKALLMARTPALAALLRLKALEWRREQRIPHHRFAFGLAGSLAMAVRCSSWEKSLRTELSQALLDPSLNF